MALTPGEKRNPNTIASVASLAGHYISLGCIRAFLSNSTHQSDSAISAGDTGCWSQRCLFLLFLLRLERATNSH